jgi:crossover junction endodeoxyribonuclease RuvC
MRILGIDPGSIFCGYGVIEVNGKSMKIVEYGTIEVKKKADDITLRMKEIYERISSVIQRTQPNSASIEATFYAKNAQSLIKLTMARSAALLAIVNNGLTVSEYSAKEVKRSVTGRGSASKEQVSFMIRVLLDIKEDINFFDTTDALAIAVCHSNNCNNVLKNVKSWKQFIKDNPDKILKLNK